MVMARIGRNGSGRVISPPNSPTRTSLPPLVRLSIASFAVLDAPTKSFAAQTPFSTAPVTCLTASLAAVDRRERAGAHRGLALGRVGVDDDGALAAHRLQH